MATVTDVEVANASFPNVRQDLNDILEALATNFSADAEPTTMYANQFWYETDTNLLKFRNEDNDAWITLAYFDQTADEWEVRTAVVQAVDGAGLALKTDEGTTRFSISDAGVVSFENYAFPSADGTAGQVLSTDGAGTLTFTDAGAGDKIEEGNSSVEVVDTGTGHVKVTVDGSETARFDANGRLGIGTTSPSTTLDISATVPTLRFTDESTNGYTQFVGRDDGGIQIEADQGNTQANSVIIFKVDTAERGRFDSSGNFKFNSGYGSAATAYGVRAWVRFTGTGTPTISASGNVSSITDNGVGHYTVNFSTAMPDISYATFGTLQTNNTGTIGNPLAVNVSNNNPPTTSSVRVRTMYYNATYHDYPFVHVAIIR